MPGKLSISVAMATYNGASYLEAQLASLAKQTELPSELVMTDDGSTDATESIIANFAKVAPFPVRWHKNSERLGYRANFMRAVTLCRSDLIAFCDQDDIWSIEKLEIAQAAFADPGVLLFYHEARTVRDGTVVAYRLNKVSNKAPRVARLKSAPWQFSPGFTQVFRSSLRDYDDLWAESMDFNKPSERAAHDEWYWFLASSLGAIAFHPEPVADYRQHSQNTFGVGKVRHGRLDRLRFILENRTEMYKVLQDTANRQSLLLAKISSSAKSADLSVKTASQAWASLSLLYKMRAALYGKGFLGRCVAMARLLFHNAYGSSGYWTFGRKALVKDLVLGVFLAPLVRHIGAVATGADWTCAAGGGRSIRSVSDASARQ